MIPWYASEKYIYSHVIIPIIQFIGLCDLLKTQEVFFSFFFQKHLLYLIISLYIKLNINCYCGEEIKVHMHAINKHDVCKATCPYTQNMHCGWWVGILHFKILLRVCIWLGVALSEWRGKLLMRLWICHLYAYQKHCCWGLTVSGAWITRLLIGLRVLFGSH